MRDKIKPTPGLLLIEPLVDNQEKTASGLYIPKNTSEKPQSGTVLAVGEGKSPVKVGDEVIYRKWGGAEVKIDDKEYLFAKFEDILAIVTKK